MKVYLRDEADMKGAYIGDVEPTRLMEVFDEVRKVSAYNGAGGWYYTDFSHQIVVEDDREAYFEIVLHGEE